MKMPVIVGVKTESERFAGAEDTYCIEALMQDGKALQAGTSHFLGQNFAKAFDVKFTTSEGKQEYVWATSWGVSTRLMGALIMTHSDDKGLVLPSTLAPIQVVIVPIYFNDQQRKLVDEKAQDIVQALKEQGISVKYDNDDKQKPGWKFAEYELKGVPVRIGIGPRDLEKGQVEVARRDTLTKEFVGLERVIDLVPNLLQEIDVSIYNKAKSYRDSHITEVNDWEEFQKILDEKGGFLSAHWDGTVETEAKIQELTKATIRCIPLDSTNEMGSCVYSGKPSKQRVLFAKAY